MTPTGVKKVYSVSRCIVIHDSDHCAEILNNSQESGHVGYIVTCI